MCLKNPKLVEMGNPVKTYKVMLFRPSDNADGYTITSPYYMHFWSIGRVESDRFMQDNGIPDHSSIVLYMGDEVIVMGGGFHSFATLAAAENERIRLMDEGYGERYVVVECEIPVESEFVYSGRYARVDCYVSEKLKPVKILTACV